MNNKYQIEEGILYITNVCNLTCTNCITYNDRIFKGHYRWEDYKHDYEKWSSIVTMERITILGGEPFSNPDLINWVKNARTLWPECTDFSVCTNGTYLTSNQNLIHEIIKNNVWIDVCVHDPDQYDQTVENVEKIFNTVNYKKINSTNNSINSVEYDVLEYTSEGQLVCKISKYWNFGNTATKEIKDGVTFMHNSDPEIAHQNCGAKHCHYFVEGKLYKCYLTGISNGLLSQFKVDKNSALLLKNSDFCSAVDPIEKIEKFINNIRKCIPQCSLCPENRGVFPIWPLATSKVKI
jgi:organic radical activating enzyme